MSEAYHRPVMVGAVLEWLALESDDVVVDLTVGGGGHSAAILSRLGGSGRVFGVDRDEEAMARVEGRFAAEERFVGVRADFESFRSALSKLGIDRFDKVLMDLGVSSRQLDAPRRGFSFLHDGPLDMRMDQQSGSCAAELVAELSESELETLLREFGEERFARRIARAIVAERRLHPITTTGQLAALVARVAPSRGRSPIHPATRTFQALRIAVNGELEQLPVGLEKALDGLRQGGRMVVLSYHSLEDRLVKRFFRRSSGECVCPRDFPVCRCGARSVVKVLTSRPRRPEPDEVSENPRARSARLRAAEKIAC